MEGIFAIQHVLRFSTEGNLYITMVSRSSEIRRIDGNLREEAIIFVVGKLVCAQFWLSMYCDCAHLQQSEKRKSD